MAELSLPEIVEMLQEELEHRVGRTAVKVRSSIKRQSGIKPIVASETASGARVIAELCEKLVTQAQEAAPPRPITLTEEAREHWAYMDRRASMAGAKTQCVCMTCGVIRANGIDTGAYS